MKKKIVKFQATKVVRKWIKPHLRKNKKGCKKEYSRVRGYYKRIKIKINVGFELK